MSKLTEEQKAAIKASDKPQTQLAKEFGVSAVTISKLKSETAAQPKPGAGGVEMLLEGDYVVIKLPRKALTKKLLAELL
jgi:transcriptional regulator with XRE-family HTH domain